MGQPNVYIASAPNGTVQLNTHTTPRSMITDHDFTTPNGMRIKSEHTLPDAHDNGRAFTGYTSSAQNVQDWWESSITLETSQNNSATRTANVSKANMTAEMGIRRHNNNTELADGQPALSIDPGSWNSLIGVPWFRSTATHVSRSTRQAFTAQRSTT